MTFGYKIFKIKIGVYKSFKLKLRKTKKKEKYFSRNASFQLSILKN